MAHLCTHRPLPRLDALYKIRTGLVCAQLSRHVVRRLSKVASGE